MNNYKLLPIVLGIILGLLLEYISFTTIKSITNHVDLLPISVVAAIVLFVIKELVEAHKKRLSDTRKINAYKQLIADELELNYGSFESLQKTINQLHKKTIEWTGSKIEAKFKEPGNLYVQVTLDGKTILCDPIRKTRFEQYNKLLVNIAEIDAQLFLSVKSGYRHIVELEHIYMTLIKCLKAEENDEPFPHDILYSGFLPYAINQFSNIEDGMKKLYFYCTQIELTKARIR